MMLSIIILIILLVIIKNINLHSSRTFSEGLF